MTENTAEVLMTADYPVVCRGKTVVKGKHELVTTYLLRPANNPSSPLKENQTMSSHLSDSVC